MYIHILKKIINILFTRQNWNIGYRLSENSKLPFDVKQPYHIVKANLRWWYADPFCVYKEDKYYVFCEMFDSLSGIGSIGMFEYSNGKMGPVKRVLKERFHLSYPNVFCYKNEYFMIPETRQANQIRLYKALNFPYDWVLDKILFDNINVADSTLLQIENMTYLFAYKNSKEENKLLIFKFDIEKRSLTLLKDSVIIDNLKIMRPAGNFIRHNENLMRPAQNNTNFYGEGLVFYKVEETPINGYKESISCIVPVSDINTVTHKMYFGIHTVNKENDMEVIDLLDSHFCIIKPVFLLTKLTIKLYKKLIKKYE